MEVGSLLQPERLISAHNQYCRAYKKSPSKNDSRNGRGKRRPGSKSNGDKARRRHSRSVSKDRASRKELRSSLVDDEDDRGTRRRRRKVVDHHEDIQSGENARVHPSRNNNIHVDQKAVNSDSESENRDWSSTPTRESKELSKSTYSQSACHDEQLLNTLNKSKLLIGSGAIPDMSRGELKASQSTARTKLDVDAPYVGKTVDRRDSMGTAKLEIWRCQLTTEQRAWVGVCNILDDDEDQSVLSKDVLPPEILQAMSESVCSMQSSSIRLKSQALTDMSIGDDDISETSDDRDLKKLCGFVGSNNKMPSLMNSSFSSFQSEISEATAVSLLSQVSAKNLIVQEHVTDQALKGFLENIAQLLEKKRIESKAAIEVERPHNSDPIFEMFSWSVKKNIDQQKEQEEYTRNKHEQGKKSSLETPDEVDYGYEDHEPAPFPLEDHCQTYESGNRAISNSSSDEKPLQYSYEGDTSNPYGYGECQPSFVKATCCDGQDHLIVEKINAYHENPYLKGPPSASVVSTMNSSMPSLTSVKESEVSQGSKLMALKWTSFGDLDFEATSGVDHPFPFQLEPEGEEENVQKPVVKTKRSGKNSRKKKVKDAKKRKVKRAAQKATNARALDRLNGCGNEEVIYMTPKPQSTKTIYGTKELPKSILSRSNPAPSPEGFPCLRKEKNRKKRYKETKSPFQAIRNRIPSLTFFGKGRRGSPTSVMNMGRQEAHFFEDFEEYVEEEWGGLLD
jgi:hypothetical protein